MNDEFKIRADEPDEDDPVSFPSDRRPRPEPVSGTTVRGINGSLVRLAFLAGLLILVFWAMRVSGKPETWRWMFPETEQGDQVNRGDLPGATDDAGPVISLGDARESTGGPDPSLPPLNGSGISPGHRFHEEFLVRFLQSLSGREQACFFTLVRHASAGRELPTGETAVASGLIQRFGQRWDDWQKRWKSLVAETGIDAGIHDRILETNRTWNESVLPVLHGMLTPERIEPGSEVFQSFRQSLRTAADSLVEQSTPPGRSVESYAWIAAWSEVFDQPIARDPQGLPRPTVTELLGQPEAWTGQTVGLQGTALLIQRVPAGRNGLGISEYHVIWIRPDHASTWPYCVYTLAPPESLTLQPDEQQRETEVPVSVAARFFKTRMFHAADQPGQAPLLMAATVEAIPGEAVIGVTPGSSLPGPLGSSLVTLAIALMAVWVAVRVWRSTLGGRLRGGPSRDQVQVAMRRLQEDPDVETIHEKLNRLGTEHGPRES